MDIRQAKFRYFGGTVSHYDTVYVPDRTMHALGKSCNTSRNIKPIGGGKYFSFGELIFVGRF